MTEYEFQRILDIAVNSIRDTLVNAGVRDFGAPGVHEGIREAVRTAMRKGSESPLEG